MSNPEEDILISKDGYRNKMVNVIINGIEKYLNKSK